MEEYNENASATRAGSGGRLLGRNAANTSLGYASEAQSAVRVASLTGMLADHAETQRTITEDATQTLISAYQKLFGPLPPPADQSDTGKVAQGGESVEGMMLSEARIQTDRLRLLRHVAECLTGRT